jgi:hypothetical protein|tara:strand:- start:832 stop:1029 length:198 start_codon:yes stop_codon:yes gene_type:complete
MGIIAAFSVQRGDEPMPTECAICNEQREEGSEHQISSNPNDPPVWVCSDCQKRLLRAVDDEVSGG